MIKSAVRMRLYPSETQAAEMRQWVGAMRALWNHLLGLQKATYEAEKRFLGHKELEKARQAWEAEEGCQWRKAPPSQTRQQVVRDLERAFRDFFKSRTGQRAGARIGFPRFKKKRPSGAFYLANTRFRATDGKVSVDKLGEMRTRGDRKLGRILGARVSVVAGQWFIAVQHETEEPPRGYGKPAVPVLGIDVGLKAAVARSDGKVIEAPRFFRKAEKQLARMQRRARNSQHGSRRARLKQHRTARLQARIADKRLDFLHVVSTRIVQRGETIALETLSIKGMARGRLAKSVGDAAMGELQRQITYKAAWAGRQVVKIGRFEPTSKTCSSCGQVHEMPLHKRMMRCECGLEIDRDINAAINIARVGAGLVGAVSAEPAAMPPTRVEIGCQEEAARPSPPVPVGEARSAEVARPERIRGRGPDIPARTRNTRRPGRSGGRLKGATNVRQLQLFT